MMKLFPVLIPCAGKGSRTGLSYPKTLHKVDNVPIIVLTIRKVLKAFMTANLKPFFVVSYGSHFQNFHDLLSYECEHFQLLHQPFQDGHGRAVENMISNLHNMSANLYLDTLLIWGDCVGFRETVVEKSLELFLCNGLDMCLPGFFSEKAYTEFDLADDNRVIACRETQKGNGGSNFTDVGIFLFRRSKIFSFLSKEVMSAAIENRESSFINVINESCNDLNIKFFKCATVDDKVGFNSFEDLDNENL